MGEKPRDNLERLAEYAVTRDVRLRNAIVEANQELVWYIVKRYTSAVATPEDMFQAGVLGLIIAIDRFDPSRGTQLSTYAVPYIQNEVRSLIDNPYYIADREGYEPADEYHENKFREYLDLIYAAVLTTEERDVIDVILRTDDEPAWSVNEIAKELKVTSRDVREHYASSIAKLNRPCVQWFLKQYHE